MDVRILASPLARRLAEQNGLDLASLTGSGPNGRIVKRDIEAAVVGGHAQAGAAAPAAKAPASAPPIPVGPSDEVIMALYESGRYELAPHDNMRKTVAQRLTESKQTIPHFYLTVDCELDALLEARAHINARAPLGEDGAPAYKVSVNDFVIKAMAMALKRVPDANVTWIEAGRLLHLHSDLAVAVAVEGGLFTPVMRDVEDKSLSAISAEMRDLAERARARRLAPHEYQGGSTTISNLGMYGIREFAAVINPPHATILAVGQGERRALADGDTLRAATCMTVTLSTDHRAVDGAVGAELLAAFKGFIEDPVTMLA